MSDDEIDFDDIKWGSFTKQFEEYNRTAKNKMKDLSAFARMFLDAPKDKFSDTTRKRANFYLNVLAKKGKSKGGARTQRITPEWLQAQYGKKLPNGKLKKIPNRRLYPDELRYVRRLFRGVSLPSSVETFLPTSTTLYDALQRIVDRLERYYNLPDETILWDYFRSILENWKKNTGIPLVIPKGVSYETPPPDVVDLTPEREDREVIDLTGAGKIQPHIVRPFFAM